MQHVGSRSSRRVPDVQNHSPAERCQGVADIIVQLSCLNFSGVIVPSRPRGEFRPRSRRPVAGTGVVNAGAMVTLPPIAPDG